MYRDASDTLDERDRAVGAILIGEALIGSCERARQLRAASAPDAWRAMRDAHDDFPEVWHSLDRARGVLARRGIHATGYDELRPHARTRLATASDADEVRVDPGALDDARRAVAELKLAVPGADWAAIERRTSGLVQAPLIHRQRNRLVLAATAVTFLLIVLAWVVAMRPRPRVDTRSADLARDLAQITEQRRARIDELLHTMATRCDPPGAHELAKQLVMDGRGPDAKAFAADYIARCGDDEVVVHWANAPRP